MFYKLSQAKKKYELGIFDYLLTVRKIKSLQTKIAGKIFKIYNRKL